MTPEFTIGAGLPPYTNAASLGHAVDGAQAIEDVGLDHVSIADVQLGDGAPAADPFVIATACAERTSRIDLHFSVLAAPLRPVVLVAAQVAAIAALSHDRVVLGIGIGGFPDAPFWRAAGAHAGRRAAHLVATIEAVKPLLRGESTRVGPDDTEVTLAPGVRVPPILIGGHSRATLARVVEHADGWYPSLRTPDALRDDIAELERLAAERGRSRPIVQTGVHAALGPDAAQRAAEHRELVRTRYANSGTELSAESLTGPVEHLAEQLAAYRDVGVDSVTVVPDGADWRGQLDTLAEARALLR